MQNITTPNTVNTEDIFVLHKSPLLFAPVLQYDHVSTDLYFINQAQLRSQAKKILRPCRLCLRCLGGNAADVSGKFQIDAMIWITKFFALRPCENLQ